MARSNPPKSPPRKLKNKDRRQREYLTPDEVERIRKAAAQLGRHGHRDATMILIAYRHGLRACELVGLERSSVNLKAATLHVCRAKGGVDTNHPLRTVEIRALGKILRSGDDQDERYVFTSERGGPLTEGLFRKIVARAAVAAGIDFPVHPHMLRHACGYKLANDGHDTRAIQHYLGHRNIQHTVRYTTLSSGRFQAFWKD